VRSGRACDEWVAAPIAANAGVAGMSGAARRRRAAPLGHQGQHPGIDGRGLGKKPAARAKARARCAGLTRAKRICAA